MASRGTVVHGDLAGCDVILLQTLACLRLYLQGWLDPDSRRADSKNVRRFGIRK